MSAQESVSLPPDEGGVDSSPELDPIVQATFIDGDTSNLSEESLARLDAVVGRWMQDFETSIIDALGGTILRQDPHVQAALAYEIAEEVPPPPKMFWKPISSHAINYSYCRALPDFVSGDVGTACARLESVIFADDQPEAGSSGYEQWEEAMAKAYHLWYYASEDRWALLPGDYTFGAQLLLDPDAPTRRDNYLSFLHAHQPAMEQASPQMALANLRQLRETLTLRNTPWSYADQLLEEEQRIQREAMQSTQDQIDRILRDVEEWCRISQPWSPSLVLTVDLALVPAIFYGKGHAEGLAKQQTFRLLPDPSVHTRIQLLKLAGDACCTTNGPPETFGMFVQLMLSQYLDKKAPNDDCPPLTNLMLHSSVSCYDNAFALINAYDVDESTTFARLRGDIYLRRGYITFIDARRSPLRSQPLLRRAMSCASAAMDHFIKADDALGRSLAVAHVVIYDGLSGRDWNATSGLVRSIGQWALDQGSYAYAQGIGLLFMTVARHWHTETGDFRGAFTLYRLAELMFETLDCIPLLASVRLVRLRYVMYHSNLAIGKVLAVTGDDNASSRYPLVDAALRSIKRLMAEHSGDRAAEAEEWYRMALSMLSNYANEHEDFDLWRLLTRESAGIVLSPGYWLNFWTYTPFGSRACVPPEVMDFFRSSKPIALLACISETRVAQRMGDRDHLNRARETASQTFQSLKLSITNELVEAILQKEYLKCVGQLGEAEKAQERHWTLLADYQLEKCERALIHEATSSTSSSDTALQAASHDTLGSEACRAAYLGTTVFAFYDAVRNGWSVLARKQYNAIMSLRSNKERVPKYWPLDDEIWRWKGMTAILLASEGDNAASLAFQAFLREIQAARSACQSRRQAMALLASPDYRFIHGKLADHLLGREISDQVDGILLAGTMSPKQLQRTSAALSSVESLKAQALMSRLGTDVRDSDDRADEYDTAMQTNILTLSNFNTFRRARKVIREGKDLPEYHVEAVLREDENAGDWDMLVDELGVSDTVIDSFARKPLSELMKSIPQNCLLLDYFYDDQHVSVWSVDHSGVRAFYRRIVRQGELERMARRLCEALQDSSRRKNSRQQQALKEVPMLINRLSKLLVHPLRGFLERSAKTSTYDSIIAVPHGILHQVPFHLLKSSETGLALGQTMKISQIPSMDMLCHVQDHLRPIDVRKAVILGVEEPHTTGIFGYDDSREVSPAPGVAEEVCLVTQLLRPTSDRSPPKTVGEMQSCLADTEAVHIFHTASHGSHDPVTGLSSNVRLPSNQIFTVKDAFGLKKSPLVIFSSFCQSVLGLPTVGGDDTEDFAYAFLAAGSCYVFGTLWEVQGDDCKVFAQEFYTALVGSAKADPAKALLMARQNLAKWNVTPGVATPSPILARWGAFVLIGTTACPPQGGVPTEEQVIELQTAMSSLMSRD